MDNAARIRQRILATCRDQIHVGRMLAKLGLRDRVQAVVLAYESALTTPGTRPPDQTLGVRRP
jgi:hypothetical protein